MTAPRMTPTNDAPVTVKPKDRYANDRLAELIYNSWSKQPGWKPWRERGNSHMQEKARREVAGKIGSALATADDRAEALGLIARGVLGVDVGKALTKAGDLFDLPLAVDCVADALARTRLAALASAPGGVIAAVRGITDDYMTSEVHHPGYVLIPTERFDMLREAEASLASAPAGDGVEPWKGANSVEQGVYNHFMTGSQRGDLYTSVKCGRMNVNKPDRSYGTKFAAWMAGRHLAEREALDRPRAAVGEQSREAGLRHAVSEAKRSLRLVQGCLECNADDERRWAETIEWLERLS